MMSRKVDKANDLAEFQDRNQRSHALFMRWMAAWSNLLRGYPTDFERFCKPEVAREIHTACGPFVLSGDRYDFNVQDPTRDRTGLNDPAAPVTISFTITHRDPRLDAKRRVKASHPDDPSPLDVRFVLVTDPGITCIEKASAEIVSPRTTVPRPVR